MNAQNTPKNGNDMKLICEDCGWTGTFGQLENGECCCPKCDGNALIERQPSDEQAIEIAFTQGMSSAVKRKTFKNRSAFLKWSHKNEGNVEIRAHRFGGEG